MQTEGHTTNRAAIPAVDINTLEVHLAALSGLDRLRALDPHHAEASPDMITAILTEAARFAADRLELLNTTADAQPPRLTDDGVRVNATHQAVWRDFVEAGWLMLDLPVEHGGQGLPLVIAVAVQEIFDRHCAAFGMMPVPIRAAARLIQAYGDPALQAAWLPQLVAGTWGATICISEVGAGSDVMRIRTKAEPLGDGRWSITGEKQWISFGDQDLTDCIGHCLLARTPDNKGLSLFLVPSKIDDQPNGVAVRRLEEKLGLHLSPTCALGFEGSTGWLLGQEGRGLAQMFVMITQMRMAVGAMGLGLASGSADIALTYAQDRRQGGTGPSPLRIIRHADVQRQVLEQRAAVELLRGLLYATAVHGDLARLEPDAATAQDHAALVAWLLPLIKTLGGDTAVSVASGAIQVLGGAGYTTDWPAEQAMRDARILPVFEGTTGMQALDLLHRRLWKEQGAGLQVFLTHARTDLAAVTDQALQTVAEEAAKTFTLLEQTAATLQMQQASAFDAEAGANHWLELAGLAALGWTAVRLLALSADDLASQQLRGLAVYYLTGLAARAQAAATLAVAGAARLAAIATLVDPACLSDD